MTGPVLPQPLAGMFFDLDGTLVDSAPDLHLALSMLCAEQGALVPDYNSVREVTSRGARAVMATAFASQGREFIDGLLPRFLDLYMHTGFVHTQAFPDIDALLDKLEARGIAWGVVTNKIGALTDPLLKRLGYAERAATVVSGDTLLQRKPDPAPVLHACAQARIEPAQCAFVGDDPRDVQAGRAAGVYTIAAGWGYLDGADPRAWNPDAVADTAKLLADWLA
ncbi:MAG: HAD-IA family hydrolase [Rhodanobacteraceae bacterium]